MGNTVICVAGPTGCGKTALGVLLAERYNGEVVSADSMQIYRGMSIGSAAPSMEERRGIPHHMIGVADPAENWSAARYVQEAVPILDDILLRGKQPILAGGTGLWMEAVIRGTAFAPGQRGGAVRRELEARLTREGIEPLLRELREVDSEAAERLHPSDTRRILRALEVWRESGETITARNAASRQTPPRYRAVWIGLRYRDRADMRERLDRRVDAMMAAGLLEEVRALAAAVPRDSTAMQGIGYKELWGVLDGSKTEAEAREETKLRTRQYAKRQLSWFRRIPEMHWITWEKSQNFPMALQVSTEILTLEGVC